MKQKLECGEIYHLYNFSNGRERLFRQDGNYEFFLRSFEKRVVEFLDSFSYCLQPKRFDFLIRVRKGEELERYFLGKRRVGGSGKLVRLTELIEKRDRLLKIIEIDPENLQGLIDLDNLSVMRKDISDLLSHLVSVELGHFFNCYAKSFNKRYHRRGSVFLKNFRRKRITNVQYRNNLVNFIHNLPVKNCLRKSPMSWPHSSIHSLTSDMPTFLARDEVRSWFGKTSLINSLPNAA